MTTRPIVIHVPAHIHNRLQKDASDATVQELALRCFTAGFQALTEAPVPLMDAVPPSAVVEAPAPEPAPEPVPEPEPEAVPVEAAAVTPARRKAVLGFASAGHKPPAIAKMTRLSVAQVKAVLAK